MHSFRASAVSIYTSQEGRVDGFVPSSSCFRRNFSKKSPFGWRAVAQRYSL